MSGGGTPGQKDEGGGLACCYFSQMEIFAIKPQKIRKKELNLKIKAIKFSISSCVLTDILDSTSLNQGMGSWKHRRRRLIFKRTQPYFSLVVGCTGSFFFKI